MDFKERVTMQISYFPNTEHMHDLIDWNLVEVAQYYIVIWSRIVLREGEGEGTNVAII